MTYWAVVQTVTNRENFVAERVGECGFEIFMPRTRMRVNGSHRVVALFPGYLFVRIIDQWRMVTKTLGVLRLIMNGEQPAACPDDEIDKIKAQTMRNGLVRLPPIPAPLAIGQSVRIESGLFQGFEAIYEGMSARDRQIVMLDMFGCRNPVELALDDTLTPMPPPLVHANEMRY